MSGKKDSPGNMLTQSGDCIAKAVTIPHGTAKRRTVRMSLAKRQVAAQYRETLAGKGFCEGKEQGRIAV